jgi:hypothetical protein
MIDHGRRTRTRHGKSFKIGLLVKVYYVTVYILVELALYLLINLLYILLFRKLRCPDLGGVGEKREGLI